MPWGLSWKLEEAAVNERTWLVGILLAVVAYGVVFMLFIPFILSSNPLIKTMTGRELYTSKASLPFIIYISLMFIFETLFLGAVSKMTQLGGMDARLFPFPWRTVFLGSYPIRSISLC